MNPDGTPRSPTLRIAKDRPEFDVSFFGYNQKINASAAPNLIEVPTTFFADVRVRRAFTYAFDYGGVLVDGAPHAGLPPPGPRPPGPPPSPTPLPPLPPHPAPPAL